MSFFELNEIPLRVIQDSKINVELGINISETELKHDKKEETPIFFFNNGYTGVSFEIECLIKSTDIYKGKYVQDILQKHARSMTPVIIVTEAIDVPNGSYIILSIKSEQEYKGESVWKMKFQQQYKFKYSTNLEPKPSDGSSSLDLALGNCKVPLQTGSQESDCIRLLQQKLKKLGYYLFDNKEGVYEINGVYDENTANAVMRLQADHKEKYHLKVSGVFDTETKDCIIHI